MNLLQPRSSLEYWEKRWQENPYSFNTSWPDTYARLLELAALRKYLRVDSPILELGCGNLQLAEDNDLLLSVAQAGYCGMDGADKAIEVTSNRLAGFSNVCVAKHDFLNSAMPRILADALKQYGTLLTKRTLQNLSPEGRKPLWPEIYKARHGCLIEGTEQGLYNLNTQRQINCPEAESCTPPGFNWYLTRQELVDLRLARPTVEIPVMAHYYLETRGLRILREWESKIHRAAYKENLNNIKMGKYSGCYGPIIAIVW